MSFGQFKIRQLTFEYNYGIQDCNKKLEMKRLINNKKRS